ncbi:hypothetical protein J4481_02340 [Candidatus Pacearchaeota archaeon]|nr:hypothetical protein [Candidatus Pacearchaeota archaeon]
MKQVLLDSNFILTCVKQKIDFIEDLTQKGIQIIVPQQVLDEIKRVSESKKKLKFRDDAKISIKILEINKSKIKIIDFESKKHVDNLIIKHAKENPEMLIATLDNELKKKIPNKILIIKEKKRIGIQ